MIFRAIPLVACVLLSACASLPGTRTALVDGRWVQLATSGQGGPVVVFESGLGSDLNTWSRVFPAVAEFTTAFAWSRPGEGASEPVDGPRIGRVVVEELRATLKARGLSPPYVLVGHSLGGLYLQLFAREYPREVAGLVLVDSSHPAQMAGIRGHPPRTLGTLLVDLYMSGTRGREFRGLNQTGADVLLSPELVGVPVTVLSAGREPGEAPTPAQAMRVDLARLYPGSHQQWVDSGHSIQLQRPEVVIEAVREFVKAARHPPVTE